MRTNLPVTATEYPLTDETLIVSKTDLKGKLTYFNDQFVEASGFTEQELAGQPHNVVRHPDMPPEAFANLWETLRAGKPWAGAVKNRRKNGDFYWVLASATPIWEEGHVVGYMSIRTKLPADQREQAERVYAAIRDKKAGAFKIEAGMIRKRSPFELFSPFTRSLKARLVSLVGVLSLFMVIVGSAGLIGMSQVNRHAQSIYEDRSVPLAQLFEINDRMKENSLAVLRSAIEARTGRVSSDAQGVVAANAGRIDKLWSDYMATYLTPEEKSVAESFMPKRVEYVERGLKPALAMLAEGKLDELNAHMTGKAAELFGTAKADMDRLVAIQVKEAKAEYDAAEGAFAFANAIAIVALCLGLLAGALLSWASIRAITRPLAHLNDIMSKIAQGVFNSRVNVERDDEAGLALRALQALQAKLGFDRESQRDLEKRAADQRRMDMHRMAGEFEAAVGNIIETVASAATELEAAAGTLTGTAESTQQLSIAVAAASEEASTNVQSVASATEQMSSSVTEISHRVQDSARMAAEAVNQARQTNDRVSELSRAAARIGDVVELINSIAGQTNLLALNATIEAARAGDAGRGFAVVASEVKALAEQTAKATGEISQQISGIQVATQESVAAIGTIGATIGSLSEISAAVAAAVEEQGAATQEISRNVQQAAKGTQDVSSNISDVQRGASETGSASSQVLSSAQSLSIESNRLKTEVDKFLATIRAA
ncbi:methyl-accepting chemotaxis protein [Bradyrhizobium sp. WYCCWR 13023]|uniref:Methyl-accepting chemotaxis protein n=1 Tax=Bradyrhizobium zhengyangense TaxID=2911009 RepID=A0A9X1RAQ7_9BRAD|nr:methyl-accepting chemotaxis protein [Bradyrhizobium zhengyangense]MCG2627993.1 methyl-accepting chemotaxis protein [Bradyrhizobium zhengyangense]MCG2642813.1 methyl-accepting chemotaxis protein [Bradyrhizobium zhengyangense]MCG2669579.1 methyl-accepting chemotaxis protein [Bradyrhizobium zhengyangense]